MAGLKANATLLPVVAAGVRENLVGVAVGVLMEALILSTSDSLRLSGNSGRVQLVGLVAAAALWSCNVLAGRRSEVKAHAAAVEIEDVHVLVGQEAARRRTMRRSQGRVAVFVALFSVVCGYLFRLPLLSLLVPVVLFISLVHAWRISVWERRHRVVLWKPSLAEVGREEWRRSPFYSTPK
ncbi:hypothetical protein [Streptomyces sp. NPDC046759]|uniref:hypothetical protein n=1 Tax=Streptomyces sp. NPDC046759 TaxID=3155019 RepID=UPI003408A13C